MKSRLKEALSALTVGAAHTLMWGWNVLFISSIYIGVLPLVLYELVLDVVRGFVPLSFLLAVLIVLLIPPVTTVLGLLYLRQRPRRLFELFYGFEVPLFFLALFRLFMVRDLTNAMAYLLTVLAIGTVFYLYSIFEQEEAPSHNLQHLLLVGHTIGLTIGLYIASFLAFHTIPLLFQAIVGFFSFGWLFDIEWMMLGVYLITLFFFLVTASLFLMLPFAMIILYVQRFRRTFQAMVLSTSRARSLAISGVVFAVLVTGFILSNEQPQHEAFRLVAEPPANDQERQALLQQQDAIRTGLLNTYLAPYRYLSSTEDTDTIARNYREAFGLSEAAASSVQSVYNGFAQPFLYQGSTKAEERRKAADLFEDFFDLPIQKGAKEEILDALEATWEREGREAGLLNEGGRKVHLAEQRITVREQGPWAEIEIFEAYENQTPEDLEIFYYFSLPDTAAATGLWLGDHPEKSRAFPFTVSTRGAAQQVYKEEVQRRVDPALLEQVGPRQYRLRAYPIPRKQREAKTKRLYLWLTYQVLPEDGFWPLPQLREARNVYFDDDTLRFINDVRAARSEAWLPEKIRGRDLEDPDTWTMNFAGRAVTATPLGSEPEPISEGRRYAVILDRSHSMEKHQQELAETFAWLARHVFPRSQTDIFLTSASFRGEVPTKIEASRFALEEVLFFGGQHPAEMLKQYDRLRADKYDAIIVLTDDGSMELADDGESRNFGVPIWMVHVGGRLAAGYDDATLETIQKSGGGVTTDVKQVFRTFTLAEAQSGAFITFGNNYVWTLSSSTSEERAPRGFAPIAARQFIRAAVQTVDLDLATLDRVHAVAKQYKIVTAYSSMICLVNDQQREALEKAEQQDDRFDREVETGEEALSTPAGGFEPLAVASTPEPGEWLLMFLVCGFLFLVYRKRHA